MGTRSWVIVRLDLHLFQIISDSHTITELALVISTGFYASGKNPRSQVLNLIQVVVT